MNVLVLLLNPAALCFWGVVIFNIYLKVYKFYRNKIYKIKSLKNLEIYNRDIDCNYTPSVLSFILDTNIELKDVSADIMNLYAKKIINIKKNNDKYEISVNEEYYNTKDISESDKYLINTLILKNSQFNIEKWKKLVEKSFISLKLTKEHKKVNISRIIKISFFIGIIAINILYYISKEEKFRFVFSVMMGTVIGLFSILPVTIISDKLESNRNKLMYLNKKGEKEYQKWMAFKRFIEDYTLIKEKNIEDIVLYEKYIPYAVVLSVNKNYKDTIYSIFDKNYLNILNEWIK